MSLINESPVLNESSKYAKLVPDVIQVLEKDENLNTININNLNKINCVNDSLSKQFKSSTDQPSLVDCPNNSKMSTINSNSRNKDTVFTLKKWNLVAMWSWDVECEVIIKFLYYLYKK